MTDIVNFKIVADSSCDIQNLNNISFAAASLKISTDEREFIDDRNLDVAGMVEYLHSYKGKSRSSCPNPADWMDAFGDAENIICVTITSHLSGSYNSAMLAKKQYEERFKNRRVFVLDSLSTGPEMALILYKLDELISSGCSYEQVICEIKEYSLNTGLMFMLESMQNLANNGRVSTIAAKIAGVLGIRVVGRASDEGELEILDKCRGENRALNTIVGHLKEFGVKNGRVCITHCINEPAALKLKNLINTNLPDVDVDINICGGLCGFYAEKGGLLVGYEKK